MRSHNRLPAKAIMTEPIAREVLGERCQAEANPLACAEKPQELTPGLATHSTLVNFTANGYSVNVDPIRIAATDHDANGTMVKTMARGLGN